MNEERDYNDTVNALISTMLNKAYETMDKELKYGTDNRTALARALADSIRNNIEIMSVESVISSYIINHVKGDKRLFDYEEKKSFMCFAGDIHKLGHYRKRTFNLGYEVQTRYQIGVFKLPKRDLDE